jgi:hypothetical protein
MNHAGSSARQLLSALPLTTERDKSYRGAKKNKNISGTICFAPDLADEQFEFILNLQTAKQIGLTIPPNVLARTTG